MSAPAAPINPASVNPRELALMQTIRDTMRVPMQLAAENTPIKESFLAALTANESGGNVAASRFEATELGWFAQVLAGERPDYQGINAAALQAGILKGGIGFTAVAKTLCDLCKSWGPTQIMGWQAMKGGYPLAELQAAGPHYHHAVGLLTRFVDVFKITFPAGTSNTPWLSLFHCWNAGAPLNPTSDPAYASRGIIRMAIYDSLK